MLIASLPPQSVVESPPQRVLQVAVPYKVKSSSSVPHRHLTVKRTQIQDTTITEQYIYIYQ